MSKTVNFLTTSNLLTTKQAASMLGVSAAFLERDRCRKFPLIPFIRISARAIRYRLEDLQVFLAKNYVGNSGQQACL